MGNADNKTDKNLARPHFFCPACQAAVPAEQLGPGRIHLEQYGGCGKRVNVVGRAADAPAGTQPMTDDHMRLVQAHKELMAQNAKLESECERLRGELAKARSPKPAAPAKA